MDAGWRHPLAASTGSRVPVLAWEIKKKVKKKTTLFHIQHCEIKRQRGEGSQHRKKKKKEKRKHHISPLQLWGKVKYSSPRCGLLQKLKLGASGFALNKVPVVLMGIMVFRVAQVGCSGFFHGATYGESKQFSPPVLPTHHFTPTTIKLPLWPSWEKKIWTNKKKK